MWVLPAMRRDSVHCATALTNKFAGVARRWGMFSLHAASCIIGCLEAMFRTCGIASRSD